MRRILAIDYGKKRIGLALSDPLKIIASPYEVWENKGQEDFLNKLDNLIIEKKVETLIIGLPKNMDGTLGFQAQEVKDVFKDYEHAQISKIVYFDERLSSKQATEILHAQGINEKKQKGIKDAYAASVFLKEYLQYGK